MQVSAAMRQERAFVDALVGVCAMCPSLACRVRGLIFNRFFCQRHVIARSEGGENPDFKRD